MPFFKKKSTESPRARNIHVVSGLPRSGTSMMMNMLVAGGLVAATDSIRVADEDNPKGYYELEIVKQLKEGKTDWLPSVEGKVVKIISYLLEFLPPSRTYKVIFMERKIEEVLASQQKMLERRNETNPISDEEMKDQYAQHLKAVKYWLARQPNIETLYVPHNTLIRDPASQCARLAEFLGVNLNVSAMIAVPDQALYRQRAE